VNWLLKQQQATLPEIAAHVEQNLDDTQTRLADLIAQGFIQSVDHEGTMCYRPHLISRKGRQVPGKIWDALT
jgi:hypothetical protein